MCLCAVSGAQFRLFVNFEIGYLKLQQKEISFLNFSFSPFFYFLVHFQKRCFFFAGFYNLLKLEAKKEEKSGIKREKKVKKKRLGREKEDILDSGEGDRERVS